MRDPSPPLTSQPLSGAESLLEAAASAGLEICFANPGTTEMPLVSALDRVRSIRPILCLQENVCTGAADGWGRMRAMPALTLLHLGPGFANGMANLHNARRARSPVINIVGEHATWHRQAGAPLAMDIAAAARPVSDWVRASQSGGSLAADLVDAFEAASRGPGQVATLIAAHDHQIEPALARPRDPVKPPAPEWNREAPERVASFLTDCAPAAIVIGSTAASDRGVNAAARIAAATGATLLVETFCRRLDRPLSLAIQRVPYFPEAALSLFAQFRGVVLAGAPDPVAFFGYPGVPSRMIPDGIPVETLCLPIEDGPQALEALADALDAPPRAAGQVTKLECPKGRLTPATLCAAVAFAQPEGAILLDEGITSATEYFGCAAGSPPHSYLNVTGGAIGWAIPCATGAALACKDRPVIAIEGDGSALYTIQALWTQAREGLNVTTVICSNRAYRILAVEIDRAGEEIGDAARSLMDLSEPGIDWCAMARSLGAAAVRVDRAEELAETLRVAVREPGPLVIEAVMA